MKDKIADTIEAVIRDVEPRLRAVSSDGAAEPLQRGGWSAKQLLGHLIDSASNNHQRFVSMQQSEHIHLVGYDQEFWVNAQAYAYSPRDSAGPAAATRM